MSQPISVSVQMDAASFHDFAAFDLLRHRKAWHRPLAFTAILLAICILAIAVRGLNLGIEFKGGADFQAPTTVTATTV